MATTPHSATATTFFCDQDYATSALMLNRDAPTPSRLALNDYRSAFRQWDKRAAVRAKERHTFHELPDALLFPLEQVPVASHPLVMVRGEAAVDEVVAQHLNAYLQFTTDLEQQVVVPVTQCISRGRLGVELPELMLADAFTISTDEAYHAQFSYELYRQINASTGTTPKLPTVPRFLSRLDGAKTNLPSDLRSLFRIGFATVSETLISSTLADIPRDERVHPIVREIIRDHAEDEGRHHAYFKGILTHLWSALTVRERAVLGQLVPELITIFLEPDLGATALALSGLGLNAGEIEQVLAESYPVGVVRDGIKNAAHATVRYFLEVGALDDPKTHDMFASYGLI